MRVIKIVYFIRIFIVFSVYKNYLCRFNPAFPHEKETFREGRRDVHETIEPADLIKVDLINNKGLYDARLNIGSPGSQMMQLIVDTQHNHISIVSTQCKECEEVSLFDDTKSKSNQIISKNFTVKMYKYELLGRRCTDYVQISGLDLMQDFELVLIDKITNSNRFNIQGFVGLGFTQSLKENFVYKLKNERKIKYAIYSLLLRGNDQSSLLYLGGYDKNIINQTNTEKILYSNITYTNNDSFTNWYIPISKVFLNDNLISSNHKIILNSVSSIIRVPSKFFFDNLKFIFNKKSECQIWKDNLFHCNCDSDYSTTFPTFTFTLNDEQNRNISVTPSDYTTIDNSGLQSTNSICILLLSPNYENEYWVLGNNFMNNYYTIFDLENSKLGLYDLKGIYVEDYDDILLLCMIIVSSSLLFFTVLYCTYKRIPIRPQSELQLENQLI